MPWMSRMISFHGIKAHISCNVYSIVKVRYTDEKAYLVNFIPRRLYFDGGKIGRIYIYVCIYTHFFFVSSDKWFQLKMIKLKSGILNILANINRRENFHRADRERGWFFPRRFIFFPLLFLSHSHFTPWHRLTLDRFFICPIRG